MMRRNSVRKRDLLAEIDGYSVSFLPRRKTVRMTSGLALISGSAEKRNWTHITR
jgi:hypothetical protein